MEVTFGAPQGSINLDIAIFTATNLARYAAISGFKLSVRGIGCLH